jgi:riboflavin kinase/FMN adenylyltransferase
LTKLLRDLPDAPLNKPSAISIGVFDGVHLGHRHLLNNLLASAKAGGYLCGVVTFDRHPHEVLVPQKEMRYLTTLEDKLRLLGEAGLDFVVALPFTNELAQTTARDFAQTLVERLGLKELWTGPDFALGKDREGNSAHLSLLGNELGFRLCKLEPLTLLEQVVSSSRIRALMREGDVSEAARMLGRLPHLTGKVVTGARRGQRLGFPTANLQTSENLIVPANGVYAVRTYWDSLNHAAVVNIGQRPTFEQDSERVLEAHILDFSGDLYGKELRVEFIERLRPELRFASGEDLIAQMRTDVAQTRRLLDEQGLG